MKRAVRQVDKLAKFITSLYDKCIKNLYHVIILRFIPQFQRGF